ncbi:LysR family transcriptional regulator [Legionella quinlivanii]|uniref:LysR family transcriptional regulator n=1 Tax=Legionella quinlivanii TaxID=45073 RepID=A0A0W0Y4W8_9GAMM|nr:LysR family transcriptional regulator [Legionella quinlivanii]KTD52060.1 LysR family transcriptional regulator [Legionella quinlivanii]MCW8452324.1 LysR family transcriptional regulator [Legionella quinlivanii]SEF88939.1 DNA-binding transcriptional regulator, LysR family [Legionella quinlivanii DSM 21216]STY12444.1 LysR family transcriptional regulator [Legionella quinlivanii]
MNSNELKSFLMVYEYRSYSLAAKRLFVTQSTISKRINNLENEFKTKLFEIKSNMVMPTIEGKLLIPYARLILHTMLDAAANLNEPDFNSVPIYIGVSIYPALHFLPNFIEFLKTKENHYPQFHIKQMAKQELIPALQNGIIDLVITTEDLSIDHSIKSTRLQEEPIVIVAASDHPLARKKKINLQTLSRHGCILTESGFSIRDKLERLFAQHGISLLIDHELFSIDSIQKLVKTGIAWTALPDSYCDHDLIKLDLDDFSENITTCWYCPRSRGDSKIIQYIAKLFRESLSSDKMNPRPG